MPANIDLSTIPFNRFIGLRRVESAQAGLSLPEGEQYLNHLGTVHAGALLALAEACSGDYLMSTYCDLDFEVIPVVRRIEAKFRKPATGAVFAKPAAGTVRDEAFVITLRDKGRALIEVAVDVHDEHHTHALSAVVEWFVIRQV